MEWEYMASTRNKRSPSILAKENAWSMIEGFVYSINDRVYKDADYISRLALKPQFTLNNVPSVDIPDGLEKSTNIRML